MCPEEICLYCFIQPLCSTLPEKIYSESFKELSSIITNCDQSQTVVSMCHVIVFVIVFLSGSSGDHIENNFGFFSYNGTYHTEFYLQITS